MPSFHLLDFLISTLLGLIMLGIGLSLSPKDFRNIFLYPKAFAAALASQMLALPVIAFLIASSWNLPPEIKVGLVILAASPGGASSGFLTYLFKGNVALSISLTTVNSLLTLFSIPIVVNFALQTFMGTQSSIHLPFWATFQHIFIVTIIPAVLGMWIHRRFPVFAFRAEKYLRYIMMLLMAGIFVIMLLGDKSEGGTNFSISEIIQYLPPVLLLNVACLCFGYFFLKILRLPHADQITAAIESGVHNTTLAFLIAGTLLANSEMVKPAILYAAISFVTAIIFGRIATRYYDAQKLKKHQP